MNEEIKHATDLVRDPNSSSPLIQYVFLIGMALWGGVVRIIREVKLGDKTWKQIVAIFVGELIVSGFVGALTFFLCEAAEFKPLYTAVMTGIAGYMGGRSLAFLETIYRAGMRG